MIQTIIEFSFCLLEMISVTCLVQKFFIPRRSLPVVSLAILGFAAIEYSMEFWMLRPALLVPVMLVNMIAMIRFLFAGKIKKLAAVVLLFYIVEGILSALSIQVLTLTANVSVTELMQERWLRILGGYFNKLAVLIPILFMKRKTALPQNESFDWGFRFSALLLFICVYINYWICCTFDNLRIRFLSILFSAISFAFLVFMLWLFQQYTLIVESKKRLELEHNCNTLKETWLAETVENQEKFRKQRHDLKHLLGILEYYINQERYLEALDYIKRCRKSVEAISKKEHTGNPIVDTLLNRTMDNAPELHFHVEAGRVLWPVGEVDTCLLISNLLSNAVEAAKLSPQKRIEFYLKEDETSVYFTLINTIQPGRRIDLNRSSKADWKEHGYGIQSIRSIVAQARGELDFHQQADRFEVRMILPKEKTDA